jgi:hypothetical protein
MGLRLRCQLGNEDEKRRSVILFLACVFAVGVLFPCPVSFLDTLFFFSRSLLVGGCMCLVLSGIAASLLADFIVGVCYMFSRVV